MANNCKIIVFSDKAYNAIIRETFAWDPVETGGILLGHILDNGNWIVMEVLPPGYSEGREGDNVHHDMGYFEYNQRFVNYLADSVATQYKIPLELLGLWHRHPNSFEHFSSTDDGTNKTFASQNYNGAISGLVHVDPQFRLNMYYISHEEVRTGRPNYQAVDFEVGSELIPEEYFEMRYYGGEHDELHPYAPTRNNQRQGNTDQRVTENSNKEESGDINIDRIINNQLGYNNYGSRQGRGIPHRNDVPDWYQQVANVFDQLKKKKLIGCLFSILIIAACFFLIKTCWDGVKEIWPDKKMYVVTQQGVDSNNSDDIEIRLVKDHFELKDFDLVQIEITPKVNERIEWKSLNPQIVAVNDKGQISAVAKEGAAKVKAVYKEQELCCYVKVDIDEKNEKNVDSDQSEIEISNGAYPDECNLQVGQTHPLNINFLVHNIDKSKISWVSKDNSIVQVDQKGRIKALSPGKTEVCLCLEDQVKDKIIINVTEKK